MELINDLPITSSEKKENIDKKEDKEELKKELNLNKPLKKDDEIKEIEEIKKSIEENKNIDYKELLIRLEEIGKNLEELMLDIDKKLYYNVEIKTKIENMEKDIQDIRMLIEEVLLTGEKAIIYYLKRNKNKPIKLKELYKKFGKKLVNKVIRELYEKGFIKVIE